MSPSKLHTPTADRRSESKMIGAYLSASFKPLGPEMHDRLMQHALRCPKCRDQVKHTLGINPHG